MLIMRRYQYQRQKELARRDRIRAEAMLRSIVSNSPRIVIVCAKCLSEGELWQVRSDIRRWRNTSTAFLDQASLQGIAPRCCGGWSRLSRVGIQFKYRVLRAHGMKGSRHTEYDEFRIQERDEVRTEAIDPYIFVCVIRMGESGAANATRTWSIQSPKQVDWGCEWANGKALFNNVGTQKNNVRSKRESMR